ncbi:hypothetical protein CEXT_468541 [Caerostris extrusa]|uniref:Uncharacterized protein n=1 Tax=Caerostris extrusa TaxID=172846 RepID=A0AAV4T1X3_CAEEX|nr:hypothetical protein CEXT_468541 [Caerostris extrusa]
MRLIDSIPWKSCFVVPRWENNFLFHCDFRLRRKLQAGSTNQEEILKHWGREKVGITVSFHLFASSILFYYLLLFRSVRGGFLAAEDIAGVLL